MIRVVIETDLGFERRRIGSCLVNLPGPAAEVALFDIIKLCLPDYLYVYVNR